MKCTASTFRQNHHNQFNLPYWTSRGQVLAPIFYPEACDQSLNAVRRAEASEVKGSEGLKGKASRDILSRI